MRKFFLFIICLFGSVSLPAFDYDVALVDKRYYFQLLVKTRQAYSATRNLVVKDLRIIRLFRGATGAIIMEVGPDLDDYAALGEGVHRGV